MARTGRLAALAVFTLIGTPLQTGLAREAGAPVAVGARLSQDENGAKLVFDLSRQVEASASALASPDRIVIDLPEVRFQVASSASRVGTLPNVLLVRGFRFGPLAPGKSRVVIDLERPACPAAPVCPYAVPTVAIRPAAARTTPNPRMLRMVVFSVVIPSLPCPKAGRNSTQRGL